jgi:hypothetical protein
MTYDTVTISSTDFNVYISVTDADTYFLGKLHADAWDDATDTEKSKALVEATRRLDNLNFSGEKNDEDQDLQFPRYDDTTIPDQVKNCCAEIAFSLLDGIDPEIEFENLSLKAIGVANARATYDREITPDHILVGIPSAAAWALIRPFLRDVKEVTISRVS